ncbi:hypothetical protein [Oceanobacillus sp. Castelsardo]|uniref:hypothetical protein n=1 Tax=Oceanobacillus sp. Castelsardo TaxID=1851204 RepID=UPI0008384BB2|nr:hypothetical protein [Oceanobacillus sp. Castelsardo]
MKKVIEGAVYNTETAKKICEQVSVAYEHRKDATVTKLKQLYKTKSGKYFFYTQSEFVGLVAVDNNDIDPKIEWQNVEDVKIIPIPYDTAIQYASEVFSSPDTDEDSVNRIRGFFPELVGEDVGGKKIQKKIYISEKTSWYLEMLLIDTNHTNSSLIDKLIFEEYKRLYKKGDMNLDMFDELED